MATQDNLTLYGCDPHEFLREVEDLSVVRFATSKSSGYLGVVRDLLKAAQHEIVYGHETIALRILNRADLLLRKVIESADQDIAGGGA